MSASLHLLPKHLGSLDGQIRTSQNSPQPSAAQPVQEDDTSEWQHGVLWSECTLNVGAPLTWETLSPPEMVPLTHMGNPNLPETVPLTHVGDPNTLETVPGGETFGRAGLHLTLGSKAAYRTPRALPTPSPTELSHL